MVQQLGTHTVLAENLSLVPSRQLVIVCNSTSRGSDTNRCLCRHLHPRAHSCHTDTHSWKWDKILRKLFFKRSCMKIPIWAWAMAQSPRGQEVKLPRLQVSAQVPRGFALISARCAIVRTWVHIPGIHLNARCGGINLEPQHRRSGDRKMPELPGHAAQLKGKLRVSEKLSQRIRWHQ